MTFASLTLPLPALCCVLVGTLIGWLWRGTVERERETERRQMRDAAQKADTR